MDTLMARMWIGGMLLGLAYGLYSGGGMGAIAILPLVGGMFGLIVAMIVDEVRGKLRKKH